MSCPRSGPRVDRSHAGSATAAAAVRLDAAPGERREHPVGGAQSHQSTPLTRSTPRLAGRVAEDRAREVDRGEGRVELADHLVLAGGAHRRPRGREGVPEIREGLAHQREQGRNAPYHHEAVRQASPRPQRLGQGRRGLLPEPPDPGDPIGAGRSDRVAGLDPAVVRLGAVRGHPQEDDEVRAHGHGLEGGLHVGHEHAVIGHVVVGGQEDDSGGRRRPGDPEEGVEDRRGRAPVPRLHERRRRSSPQHGA